MRRREVLIIRLLILFLTVFAAAAFSVLPVYAAGGTATVTSSTYGQQNTGQQTTVHGQVTDGQQKISSKEGTAASGESNHAAFHLVLNGQTVHDAQIIMKNDTLYAPVRFVSERFGAKVDWNGAKEEVTLHTASGDSALFTIGRSEVDFDGKTYYMNGTPYLQRDADHPINSVTYMPLRITAELLHSRVRWDNASQTAAFDQVPLYEVQQGDSLASLSAKLKVPVKWLAARNGWNAQEGGIVLKAGTAVRTVVPEFLKTQDKYKNVALLAKIIDAEAGDEPMAGKIAVGDVILNRMKAPDFPDTLHGVLYAPGQFPPAENGLLDKLTPPASCVEAAVRAINGVDVVADAVYFYNPRVDDNSFFESLTTVKVIGGHKFAK